MSKSFNIQKYRKDILSNMLANTKLTGKQLFDLIMLETKEVIDERRQGWIYESLCQILIVLKCVQNLNYSELLEGQLQNLIQVKNINALLKLAIDGGGNNIVDLTIKQGYTMIPFSIKYRNKYSETDVSKIDNTITKQNLTQDYKIGLFVKNKDIVINHKYHNELNIDKQLHDKIIEDGLIFDEQDIIRALSVFIERFSNNILSINEFIEFINAEYLLTHRQQLTKKLHQQITLLKFINSFLQDKKMFCIAHKPRSGKSISLLLICKFLLEQGYKKILIMTSVPATINSFINDLETWIDFKNINYKLQKDFNSINDTFNGIVFCSVQYLKTDGQKKKELLKKMGFDAIITDESHQGSSTDKTKVDILDVNNEVEEICKNIKLKIFASGTANKTKQYYKISSSQVYEWEMEDEAYMKELMNANTSEENKKNIVAIMVARHGDTFIQCLENDTLNKDYSKHPIQVLMKHSLSQVFIDEIINFNFKNKTNYGISCSSLLALKTSIKKKEVIYEEEFEICKTSDGIDILKDYCDGIISSNKMRNSVMRQIELTQSSRNSRKSSREEPLLFIIYLPTHTGNSTIGLLQKTLIAFLKKHNLWSDYNIEYSNASSDSSCIKEEYNSYLETIMSNTKKHNKKGCILLLGNKGGVGITYKYCDVTISLDDGHNIDNIKQRYSRALTEAYGKTIGINVDMNIQRTYLYLLNIVYKHRTNTKTTKTNAEILYYLHQHNIFLFDPHQVNNETMKTTDIMSYFQKEAEAMMKEIDDTHILEELKCDDELRNIIKDDFKNNNGEKRVINEDLEGLNKDCPKGDKDKDKDKGKDEDKDENKDKDEDEDEDEDKEKEEKMEVLINKTYEMCKGFLFPLLALLSKSYKIYDFAEIFVNEKTKELVTNILKNKKIEINNYIMFINIMNKILTNNSTIVDSIREIYRNCSPDKLRQLIAKHFIPTANEQKNNAEVPTPVKLVDEMLDKMPLEIWSSPNKVFEPCCGKGNFVLGIFDRFYIGLEAKYPDNTERCKIIMTQCIYYADLTTLNVFITTELLKCHIQSYCGLDVLDYNFNNYTGDTLQLDIKKTWNSSGFNAVIGNPPYNSSGDTSTGNTLWQDFTKKSLNNWLVPNGYLLFVHPPGWRKPNTERGKFTKLFDLMTKQNQMLYLEIHGIKDGQKVFNKGTRYDLYLIEKKSQYKNTNIVDEDGKHIEINLTGLSWLPNSYILEINNILAKNSNENCDMIYSPSAYEHRKKWMSHTKTDEFKYQCVHSTPKTGIRYMYSNVNDRGHFGVSKIIFGEAGINDIIVDIDGQYGLTNGAIGIRIANLEEGNNIKKALISSKFHKMFKGCLFSSYRIDWNIFKEFKKDFWKEFV